MRPTEMEFFKMSAAGNDFILFDNRAGALSAAAIPDFVRRVSTRALSVGGDGVILIEPSERANVRARFFNPDGHATFCGNGARCAARLAWLKGIAPSRMTLETDLMVHRAEVRDTSVVIEMRDPGVMEEHVEVEAGGERVSGTRVDTGVPHLVIFRETALTGPIEPLGSALRSSERFAPEGVNVNVVWPSDDGALAIRTFERGVERETLACGTGCVAAAVAAAAAGRARSPVLLRTRSGASLRVYFEGDPRRAGGVRLEGEARLIYVGQLTAESIEGFTP